MTSRKQRRRAQHARWQADRRAAKRSASAGTGSDAEYLCGSCGTRTRATTPVLGVMVEYEGYDDAGQLVTGTVPLDEAIIGIRCPVCGGDATAINAHGVVGGDGAGYTFFASTEADRATIEKLLRALEDPASKLSREALEAQLEAGGGALAGLAEWLREYAKSVPMVVLEVVLTVILTQMVSGPGLTARDLDRILDEQQAQYRDQEEQPSPDRRDEPHERSRPADPDADREPERQLTDEQHGRRDRQQHQEDDASGLHDR